MDANFFDIAYADNEMNDIIERILLFFSCYPELKGVLLKRIKDSINEDEEL